MFEHGALVQSSLTNDGQARLGALLQTWQTKGIQIRDQVEETQGDEVVHVLLYKEVLLTSPNAQRAVACWASDHGDIVVSLPTRLLTAWEKLCGVDLQPVERFDCLHALLQAPHRLVQAWDQAVETVALST